MILYRYSKERLSWSLTGVKELTSLFFLQFGKKRKTLDLNSIFFKLTWGIYFFKQIPTVTKTIHKFF